MSFSVCRCILLYWLCWSIVVLAVYTNDFENTSHNELWSFVNSQLLDEDLAAARHAILVSSPYKPPNKPVSKEDNFRTVVGGAEATYSNSSNHYAFYSSREPRSITAMIVSTFFQHTSTTCELVFRHRIHGLPGSAIVVTTQHLDRQALLLHHHDTDEEDAEDWIRPTLRASFKPIRDDHEQWTTSNVPIGQILYPTRIRIECHTAQEQRDPSLLNVECNVDDIKLVNCDEEIWKSDICASRQTKKYLCHRTGSQKCIEYSDVCDFYSECDEDEDENPQYHKCNNVLPGARCDFELRTNTGCAHWKFFSPSASSNNGSRYLQRISLADTKNMASHGLPPSEITYHGFKRTAGHFLFFSTYGLLGDNQPSGDVLYTYATTPQFPPTSQEIITIDSPHYRSCIVRFFYCHTGTSTFQLMLENGADFTRKEVLWTPPKTQGSEPCTWQKASAVIPHQTTEYRLKIAFGKLYKQPISVAIDDFTMTPDCFLEPNLWSSRFLPDRLRVETCVERKCNDTTVESGGVVVTNDKRSWLVPSTSFYHIQLFGAAGGYLPLQKATNLGGIVAANLKLQRNQELSFVVGHAGINPCKENIFVPGHAKTNLEHLRNAICLKNPNPTDTELARRDVQNLFGSSGGGASSLFVDDNLIAVAGAGGGLFPEAFMSPPDDSRTKDPRGGEFFDANSSKDKEKQSSTYWSAGAGANIGLQTQHNNLPPNCAECGQMAGYSTKIKERRQFLGGTCPRARLYNVTGAYGGGGASCGPGSGGGSGFHGGNAGHKSHADGGTSVFIPKGALFETVKGVNPGDGKILIIRCALNCPVNSTCNFDPPKPGVEPKQFCLCNNGQITHEKGICDVTSLWVISRVGATIGIALDVEPGFVLFFSSILLILIVLLPTCICYMLLRLRYQRVSNSPFLRRLKRLIFANKGNDLVDLYEINSNRTTDRSSSVMERSRSTVRGNLIKENPIYEHLILTELPHISRHFLELKKSIGHGAFGEVFEGHFHLDGSYTKVAVKTLPVDSNPDIDCDFEMEARLLSQFDHQNIVKFYGVSFEQKPKYIILEYLEGGDLRNFLRENRPRPNHPLDEPHSITMGDLINMAVDVSQGCAYLESAKFIHRDLASRNCLLTTKGPNRTVKITDFGMARDIFSSEYYRKGGRAFLAVKWMPPESFLDGIFTTKTDVWSFGVLCWEIFSLGFMPYTMKQNQEVMQLVVDGGRLEPPLGIPGYIYEKMLECWNTEPDARPTFDDLAGFFLNLATTDVMDLPVPPILYRQTTAQTQSQTTSTNTPPTTRSSIPSSNEEAVNGSQMTVSTAMASSMTESTTNSSVSVPTQGEGVNYNVFPPYQSRYPKPLMEIHPPNNQLARESSMSSHDDSTLHDACSVKQSPYRIDRNIQSPDMFMNDNLPKKRYKSPPPPINPRTKNFASSKDTSNDDPQEEDAVDPSTEGQTSPLV